MKIILDSKQIEQVLGDLTNSIIADTPPDQDIAVIGIRSRGEVLAQRLSSRLSQELGKDVPCGILDITLYRDDLNSPSGNAQPRVRTTEIGFDIDDKIIVGTEHIVRTDRYISYRSESGSRSLEKSMTIDGKSPKPAPLLFRETSIGDFSLLRDLSFPGFNYRLSRTFA